MQTLRITERDLGDIKVNIENWVKWMAIDATGALWGYASKPSQYIPYNAWVEGRKHSHSQFIGLVKPPKNWKNELYTWS